MKKYTTLFLILYCCLINSFEITGQNSNFKIEGTINVDSGKIYLNFNSDYIPNETNEIVAEIKNKRFSFSGYIPESQGVFIALENSYMSSNFVIDKGEQAIFIDIDSVRKVPEVKNKTMLEEYPSYITFYKEINAKKDLFNQKRDSLYKLHNYDLPGSIRLILDEEQKAIYNASDSALLKYTEVNPNSKIAFWNLVSLMSWGYEPIFDSIYNNFSDELKRGYAGKILGENIQNSKQLSVGHMFPSFDCQNRNEENFSSLIFYKNKFTLVDFWFSKCGPCLVQFSRMRDLYEQYSNSGFEIIGISVDQIRDKQEWEDVIVKEKLVWKQYWDKDGKESQRFSINAFPTNFLIDSTGKIKDKNISMEALSEFFSSHGTSD
jgi:peroxiredoxin